MGYELLEWGSEPPRRQRSYKLVLRGLLLSTYFLSSGFAPIASKDAYIDMINLILYNNNLKHTEQFRQIISDKINTPAYLSLHGPLDLK